MIVIFINPFLLSFSYSYFHSILWFQYVVSFDFRMFDAIQRANLSFIFSRKHWPERKHGRVLTFVRSFVSFPTFFRRVSKYHERGIRHGTFTTRRRGCDMKYNVSFID